MPKTTKTSAASGASACWSSVTASEVSTAMAVSQLVEASGRDHTVPSVEPTAAHGARASPTPDDGARRRGGQHGRMTNDQHFDVAVIGTGAGGGTLGHRLAMSGKRVLWLERGP